MQPHIYSYTLHWQPHEPYKAYLLMKWNEVAKSRMKDLGITQEKLSEHLGITPGAVSHWLNARRSPELEVIAKILHLLQVNEFKVDKDGSISTSEALKNPHCTTNKIHCYPLLPKEVIINHIDTLNRDETDSYAKEWIESGTTLLGRGFWYKVEGDGMLSPTGFSIPAGSLVLFDMGRVPQDEDLILFSSPNVNDVNFKKIQFDGHRRLLVPINPRWPVDELTEKHRILAVAVESRLRLK